MPNNDYKIVNPYANTDGTPKNGEETDFFAWEKKQAKKFYDSLTEAEKKAYNKAEKGLNNRMAN